MTDQVARGKELLQEADRICKENGKTMMLEWYAELPSEDRDAMTAAIQSVAEVVSDAFDIFRAELANAYQQIAKVAEVFAPYYGDRTDE